MKTRSLRRKRLFGNLLTYCIVAAAFVILQLLNAGGMLSPSLQGQLVPICAYVTMAVALNLVVGISGELSLGHAGFMSVGAFSGVVVQSAGTAARPRGSPLRRLGERRSRLLREPSVCRTKRKRSHEPDTGRADESPVPLSERIGGNETCIPERERGISV